MNHVVDLTTGVIVYTTALPPRLNTFQLSALETECPALSELINVKNTRLETMQKWVMVNILEINPLFDRPVTTLNKIFRKIIYMSKIIAS